MKEQFQMRPGDAVELRSGRDVLTGWFWYSDTARATFGLGPPARSYQEQRTFFKSDQPDVVYETPPRPAPGSSHNEAENYYCAPSQRKPQRFWTIRLVGAAAARKPMPREVHDARR